MLELSQALVDFFQQIMNRTIVSVDGVNISLGLVLGVLLVMMGVFFVVRTIKK